MKENINITDYTNHITAGLSKGILLNTQADKFNTMVIGGVDILQGLPISND